MVWKLEKWKFFCICFATGESEQRFEPLLQTLWIPIWVLGCFIWIHLGWFLTKCFWQIQRLNLASTLFLTTARTLQALRKQHRFFLIKSWVEIKSNKKEPKNGREFKKKYFFLLLLRGVK
jgi:hypothetical protein